MEKKRLLQVVLVTMLLLLLAPIASAKITILNNFKDMYNLGETVTVDGYLVAASTADAPMTLELQCPGYTKDNTVNLKINKGQKVTFASLGIANFVLPSDKEGTCDIEATFNGESANSDSFTVLNDLLASFDIGQDQYQLGETLTLSGIVFKLDGSDVSGTATIYLKKSGSYAVQLDTATVTNGQLSYSKQLADLEYGTYTLDVKVADDAGNSQYFESVDSFTINTDLTVRASAAKYSYEPGEEVVIHGEIDGAASQTNGIEVIITFDSLRYTTTPSGSAFDYSFFVPKNMKSGDYGIDISIKDSYGNTGTDSFILTVKQIPTTIENALEKTEYKPGDTLSMNVKLYDQSNKIMTNNVNLQITDPSGTNLYNGIISTGQTVQLDFGKYSMPGQYTIISTYLAKNLQDTDKVTVDEVKSISSSLDGEMLTITNTGNVVYSDRVDLILVTDADGTKKYYVFAKDVSLTPGESATYDLSYEVPEGKYTLVVDGSAADLSDMDDATLATYADQLATTDTTGAYKDVVFAEDNRPLSKKVDQGLSSVTGASTISTYDTNITPWFLVLIVFIFGGLLGLYGYQHRAVIEQAYENYKKKKLQQKEESDGFLSTMEHKGSYASVAPTNEEGDIATEEVDKLIAAGAVKKAGDVAEEVPAARPVGMNIGTFENQRTSNMKIQGVKSGTTAFVFDTETRQTGMKAAQPMKGASSFSTLGKPATPANLPKKAAPLEPQYDPVTGKKINRFSTWTPPAEGLLANDKTFPAKNPVKEQSALDKDKEKAMYEDIDEDFLRDEKF